MDSDNSNQVQQCEAEQKTLARNGQSTWVTDNSRSAAVSSSALASGSPTLSEDGSSEMTSTNVNYESQGQLFTNLEILGVAEYVGMNPDCIPDEALPANFNWNNINGYSFYPHIRNQE